MAKRGESRNFQVDLAGMIDLLSHHLYSGPEVFVRELLQNAVDAITARRRLEPQHPGSIRFEVLGGDGPTTATLTVVDDGIGLTEDEVHRFLATIGQSSKRGEVNRDDFIGQFGIGLLSAFVVSEEIVVITRSAKGDEPAIEWRGKNDGTYTVRTLEGDFDAGTQVYLRAKPGCHEFFESEFLLERARHFGALLPEEVVVIHGDTRTVINEDPPWRDPEPDREAQRNAMLDYGRKIFDMAFLDAVPLNATSGGVTGIAYILPFSMSAGGRRADRVYLKNMLLSEQADNLLPDWAFFVKCVVNVTSLRPTAAREGFYEDDALQETRDALGEQLRQYLIRLAREDRQSLNRLIALHHLPLKSLALEDDEFFRLFVDWFPFETTLGQMTLGEYRAEHPVVRFVETRDEFRQIAGVAAAEGISIVNGGYVHDADLLAKLPEVFDDVEVERVDPSSLTETFEELTLDERDSVFEFIRLAQMVLQPFECSADIKRFRPQQIPALYTINEDAAFLRSVDQSKDISDELWSGVLDRISESHADLAKSQLCFNYDCDLVRRLASIPDRNLAGSVIELLYVQSLMLGHYPLRSQEHAVLNKGLLGLIDRCLSPGDGSKE